MTQKEVYTLLTDHWSVYSIIEITGGGYRLVLQDGIGWVDILDTETIVWDDLEVFFSESFDHSKMNESEFLEAYDTSLNNLYESIERQFSDEN
jgi:hypothetical protein